MSRYVDFSLVVVLTFSLACVTRVAPQEIEFPEQLEEVRLDFSGTWMGYFGVYKRSPDRKEDWRGIFRFPVTFDLVQDGSQVSGSLRLASDDATQGTSYTIEGVVSGHNFYWRGDELLLPGIGFPFECMLTGQLSPVRIPEGLLLKGEFRPYTGSPQGCTYGAGGIAVGQVQGEAEAPAAATESTLAKVERDMTEIDVRNLLGEPDGTDLYPTGKAWNPFYFGSDTYRLEWIYTNVGRVLFSRSKHSGALRVIEVLYNPEEP